MRDTKADLRLVGVREACHRVSLSHSTLKKLRLEKKLIAGVHYFKVGDRKILYNLDLLIDFLVNAHAPDRHLKNCENFLKRVSK